MDATECRVAGGNCARCRVLFTLHWLEGAERLSVIPDDAYVARAGIPIVAGNALLTANITVAAKWIGCVHTGFVDASIDRAGFTVVAIFVAETAFWKGIDV